MLTDLFAPTEFKTVPVQLPLAIDTAYDYLVPENMELAPGDFVLVPLSGRQRIGVVWTFDEDEVRTSVDPEKLKSVISQLDVPPLPDASIVFAKWVAQYNLIPVGMVLRMMMSARQIFEPQKPRFGVKFTGSAPPRMTPARTRVLELAENGLVWPKKDIAEAAGVSTAVIDGLVKAGTLAQTALPRSHLPEPQPRHAVTKLTAAQEEAAHQLRAVVQEGGIFSATLLDGVTGSGKTEVYFEAVAEALEHGLQVLILLPEIALTSQFVARFEARFGCRPVEWHSSISANERAKIWRATATGEARAVIGARSALYLPFCKLGLIIVDEEHDTAFKQEDRVNYQGRDMAVVRASLGDMPIILASATPSIESLVNCKSGRYRHVRLPERFAGKALPEIAAIDMRTDPPDKGYWLSPVLTEAVRETLAKGQQALLFLNRRGYAPLTLCRSCGHRFNCPQCSAWLVEHRFRHSLTCHHCGFTVPPPKACPKCGDVDSLVPCGPGVERVAEEVVEKFPDARLAILSSDHAPNVQALKEVIRTIAEGEADIIIGTQLVAKGHNFPGLALVGVVDGDLGLAHSGDLRAAERTYQLLCQVTGRAGRADTEGRGLVQTHNPDHPVIKALLSGEREEFLEREIVQRHEAGLPPFGRLASLIITSKSRETAQDYARAVALRAPASQKISVLGPAEAPIAVIRGRHRFRLLVKAPKETDLQAYLRSWMELVPKAKGDLRLNVDIDPYNFM